MISGIGLIGKLSLFVAEKLIGHKFTIALDDKKRACRAFVELYHCIDRLEELNEGIVDHLSFNVERGHILIDEIEILLNRVEGVSNRFVDLRGELYYALELLDPVLATTVYQLYAAKGSFLHLVSKAIRYEGPRQEVEIVEYQEPRAKILTIDMDAFYEWTKTADQLPYDHENAKLEWPANLLRYGVSEVGFQPSQIVLSSSESLDRFRNVLIEHGSVLSSARAKMREFIVSKFSPEDILYVSKVMRRDEY